MYIYDIKLLKPYQRSPFLIISVATGHDLFPRGIFALNNATFELEWIYETGSRPTNEIIIYDLDEDGQEEIFFATWAPNNNYSKNYDADSTSSFIILNADRQLIFKKKFADKFSYCFFMVNSNSNDIVINGYTNSAVNPQSDYFLYKNG